MPSDTVNDHVPANHATPNVGYSVASSVASVLQYPARLLTLLNAMEEVEEEVVDVPLATQTWVGSVLRW